MNAETLRTMAADPAEFRQRVLIDTDEGPRPLAAVVDPWQRVDFQALDSGWQRLAGQTVDGGFNRAYLERGRGHSKTSDLAVMACWALAFAPAQLSGVVAAADKDQARLLRDAINRLLNLNPWLRLALDVALYKVTCQRTGAELIILASDAASSYGLTPHFILIDELTHWQSGALWESLISAAAKRANCLVVIISNAGLGQGRTWQWIAREACRTGPGWYFSRCDGPVASWITSDRLDEQRRLLPPKAFARLWLNEWTTDDGDCLDPDLIERAITQSGAVSEPVPGRTYCVGLDLAVRRDYAALALLEADPNSKRIRVAACQVWKPPRGGEIDLAAVQTFTAQTARRFRAPIFYDPHQCALLAQNLRNEDLRCTEVPFTGANCAKMASTILQIFNEGRIDLFRHNQLIDDLRRLTIVQRSFGFKLEAARDLSGGHADSAFALAIGLPAAAAAAQTSNVVIYEPFRPRVGAYDSGSGGLPSMEHRIGRSSLPRWLR